MKRQLSIAFAILLVALTAVATEAPLVDAHLTSLTTAKEIRDGSGPLNMKFQIAITNRSDAPVTVTRVEVRTDDTSGFSLSDGSRKVRLTIAPQATETIDLTARRIESKDTARSEALQVFVRVNFKGPNGGFIKEFSEFIQ
jgi:hypothetical protein